MPAYGFRFPALEGHPSLDVRGGSEWPAVELTLVQGEAARPQPAATCLPLPIGRVEVRPHPTPRARFVLREEVTDEELIHPNLQAVGSALARWCGREVLHGGALVVAEAVWGVLGDRGAGKSTLLAHLHEEDGMEVFADDLLAFRGSMVCAGPRTIVRRTEAPQGAGGDQILRLSLPPCPAERPLAGWIVLGWSRSAGRRRLSPRQLAYELSRHRSRLEIAPEAGLPPELVTPAAWKIFRPRDWPIGALARLVWSCLDGEGP